MAKAKKRLGFAFSQETGLNKYVEVLAVDRLAVDAKTLCNMLGYEYSTETMAAFRRSGLPEPKAPAGSDRWDIEEVREWFATRCPRANRERPWPAKRRESFVAAQARREQPPVESTH